MSVLCSRHHSTNQHAISGWTRAKLTKSKGSKTFATITSRIVCHHVSSRRNDGERYGGTLQQNDSPPKDLVSGRMRSGLGLHVSFLAAARRGLYADG